MNLKYKNFAYNVKRTRAEITFLNELKNKLEVKNKKSPR